MALFEEEPSNETRKTRPQLYSPGHDPPKYVDHVIPTLETRLYADGGPGKRFPGAQGTNPWILGTMTVGTNRVFNIDLVHLETSSPNVWFKVRHNHSGSAAPTAGAPYNHKGGTLDSWHLAARGGREIVGRPQAPILSIRSGTVSFYAFGAGSAATSGGTTQIHKALSAVAAERFSGKLKGHIA